MTPVCSSTTDANPGLPVARLTTRAQIAVSVCACAGASAFLYTVDPSRHAVYPQCLLYNTTGIYCAGCGTTRALHALLHGRVIEALHDNALFVGALPLLLYVVGTYTLAAWRADAWPQVPVDGRKLARNGVGVFALMMVFMILRNLPGWPFDWLKPLAG